MSKGILRNKRGQLFLIEVLIAVSVLVIMVAALGKVTTSVDVKPDTNLDEQGLALLTELDQQGLLEKYAAAIASGSSVNIANNRTLLISIIDTTLSDNVEYKLQFFTLSAGNWVEDTTAALNSQVTVPATVDLTVVEYVIPGYGTTLQATTFRLSLWYLGVG